MENKYEKKCSIEYTLDKIGGKWKAIILWHLGEKEVLRYSQMKNIMSDITHKMLSIQLKELVQDGIIHRKQYNQIPPKVEYRLSAKGKTIIPILDLMHRWGEDNW